MTVPVATIVEEDANFQRDVPYAVRAEQPRDSPNEPTVARHLENRPELRIVICMMVLIIIVAVIIVFLLACIPVALK